MAALKDAAKLLDQLKAAYTKGSYDAAKSTLSQLKLKLIELPALPPLFQASATAQQELLVAREAYEHAVLISLKAHDEALLERSFAQLKTFYDDTRSLLPASSQEFPMLGLNLLRLLVQNRIAEFHTELELISPEVQANPYVQHAVQLERWLMEGAYNKVLEAGHSLPKEFHGFYLEQLNATVRDEIASCSEQAYTHLSLADAQKLMMLGSQKDVLAFAEKHGWTVQGSNIMFQPQAEAGATKELPSIELINNALVYAKELERIV